MYGEAADFTFYKDASVRVEFPFKISISILMSSLMARDVDCWSRISSSNEWGGRGNLAGGSKPVQGRLKTAGPVFIIIALPDITVLWSLLVYK